MLYYFHGSQESWKYLIIDCIWFLVTLKYRHNLLVLQMKIDFGYESERAGESVKKIEKNLYF